MFPEPCVRHANSWAPPRLTESETPSLAGGSEAAKLEHLCQVVARMGAGASEGRCCRLPAVENLGDSLSLLVPQFPPPEKE